MNPLPGSVEWMARIVDNADAIPVRAQVDGEWRSVMLSDCSPEDQARYVQKWISEGKGAPTL